MTGTSSGHFLFIEWKQILSCIFLSNELYWVDVTRKGCDIPWVSTYKSWTPVSYCSPSLRSSFCFRSLSCNIESTEAFIFCAHWFFIRLFYTASAQTLWPCCRCPPCTNCSTWHRCSQTWFPLGFSGYSPRNPESFGLPQAPTGERWFLHSLCNMCLTSYCWCPWECICATTLNGTFSQRLSLFSAPHYSLRFRSLPLCLASILAPIAVLI